MATRTGLEFVRVELDDLLSVREKERERARAREEGGEWECGEEARQRYQQGVTLKRRFWLAGEMPTPRSVNEMRSTPWTVSLGVPSAVVAPVGKPVPCACGCAGPAAARKGCSAPPPLPPPEGSMSRWVLEWLRCREMRLTTPWMKLERLRSFAAVAAHNVTRRGWGRANDVGVRNTS